MNALYPQYMLGFGGMHMHIVH
ncbi:hypothetical protein KM92DES2_11599 [uncultured Desulfovibrio sp.]|uniref:Uncharacterized protein n=1 Tax=uncultured Desulfovibrio sp. TaxID=167968 RepID=A0A212JRI2_9BACT|nr:hypothetical protein KM92DES2_11599 [uncultured Desulfovibrio sp.]